MMYLPMDLSLHDKNVITYVTQYIGLLKNETETKKRVKRYTQVYNMFV
jgi:hypothetical protein